MLAEIAIETGKRGICALAVGHLDDLAGVCATNAKHPVRQARLLGLKRWRSGQ